MITALAFYAFAAVLVASAAMVVTSRNPVHSVLFLILAFFNAAALFLIAGAEFLAMILVIVYVGAVAVLFLFVVMMLDVNFTQLREGFQRYLPVGLTVGVVLLAELVAVGAGWSFLPTAPQLRGVDRFRGRQVDRSGTGRVRRAHAGVVGRERPQPGDQRVDVRGEGLDRVRRLRLRRGRGGVRAGARPGARRPRPAPRPRRRSRRRSGG